MITIHSPNASDFSNNGLGTLEPISCVLSVTINGTWSLELEQPFDEDEKYKKVEKNNIIKVDYVPIVREQSSSYQLFRIYDTVRTLSSVKAIAFPVAFEATYDAIIEELNIDKKTATSALQDIMAYLALHGVSKYTVTSDYSMVTARQKKGSWSSTNLIAAISGSDEGSIINHWGGEVAYDNYHIIVNGKLGSTTDYDLRYGKNLTGLSVDVDTSGVVTRLYPVSNDKVRFKKTVNNTEISYIDSPDHIDDYPYIRGAFIDVPYKLIDTTWEGTVHSDTQIKTHEAIEDLTEDVQSVATQLWNYLNIGIPGSAWDNKWYEPEWVQSILNDAIAQCQKNITANITHPTWKNLIQTCIKQGLSYIKDQEIPEFYWEQSLSDSSVWTYTNGLRTIAGQYYYIDKRYCKFNGAGNYEPPADEASFDWVQIKGSNVKKKFGNNRHYMAHNEDVYITMNGTLVRYYMDEDGWYDNNEDVSEWSKHNWGTSTAWFGEDGATSEDKNKYAHDTWLFIDGTYYYFDSDGYVADQKNDYRWDWVKEKEKYWFGNDVDHEYAAVYVTDQWLKINGEWYKFKNNGTLKNMKEVKTEFINLLSSKLSTAISNTITTHQGYLYSTLYEQMEEYCNDMFEDGVDLPVVNVTANIVDLSQTTEYRDTSVNLGQIKLGDSVMLRDFVHQIYDKNHEANEPEYKDEVEERVVGLKYDCIKRYNTEITISDPYRQFFLNSTGNKYTGKLDQINMGDEIADSFIAGLGINIDANGVISADAPIGDVFEGTRVSVETSLTGGVEIGTIYVNGVPYTLYCTEEGGLKYWIETEHDIYRTGSHPETEISDRYYYDTVRYWQSRSATHMYYGQYNFKRANDYPAIIGNYGTGMVYFVLASEVEHGADWLWANADDPSDTYHSPVSGDGRYVWSGTVTYHGKTYYASIGQYNFEQGDQITTPFVSFNTDNSKPYASIVADLLDTAISTVSVNDITGISNQNTVFYFGNGSYANHENVAWITKDGVFHGKGFEVDGEPISGLSKTELYSGSQYTSPINLSESYNGFSFILIETYNSNDKKNLSTLLSVSDLTSGSYVGIDNYLLYTITNTKKFTFHDDFDDTNHSRYIKKIYGLRSGDSEHGGSDNAVLDVNVDGNSVVANRIANIDLTGKQDNLIAGNNITIGSDGKTINAADTDEISELEDVSITNLANGQILKWNSTTSKWENANGGGGGSTVDIDPTLSSGTKIADYEIDGVAGELYAPTPVTYNDYDGSAHGLVAPPSTTGSGRYLKEDGTWDTPSGGGGGASALNDLSDVSLSSPSGGQVLAYNSTTNKWENYTPSGGTTVVANPSGQAITDLIKLQVGNDIYSIPSGGESSDEIIIYRNGSWTNQSYISFAEYLCTETASGIECQGMHAGVVVSSVSNLNNAYSIVMIIESLNGFDYQTGRCYPNNDLDGVISYGTDRITYNNDSVGAGDIEVEIQTSDNTEGVFFGGGYGVSTTDYVIKVIKLVPVQKRKYS